MFKLSPDFGIIFRGAVVATLVSIAVASLVACDSRSVASLVASGEEFVAKRDYPSAILQFKSALQLDPRSPDVRLKLGVALLASGDAGGATLELSKALESGASAKSVMPPLSMAMVLTGNYQKLVAAYGDVDLDDPSAQAELKVNIATAWGALSDRPKTEANLAAALLAKPGYPPAQLLKARVLAGQRNYQEAKVLVDESLANDPQSYDAWLLRGELLYFGSGDEKAAEAAYRKAVALSPSNVLAHAAIISTRIRARDLKGAREQAKELRNVAPKHPHTLLVEAQLAFLDGRFEQARELLQRLLQMVPDHAGVLILAGAAEFQLGSVAQAAAHFGKALQLYPSIDVVRTNLAEVEIRLGQHSKALETLRPLLQASPPRVVALSLAADAELRLNRPGNAERLYQQAAQLAPDDERVQTAAALTRMWGRDVDVAIGELQALSAKSVDTYADEALFAAHMRRRSFDAALQTLDVIERKKPNRAATQELRGRVHFARNDTANARLAFEAARRIEPTLTAALISLADIDATEGQADAGVRRLEAGLQTEPRNSALLLAQAEMKARAGRPIDEVKALLADAVKAAPSSAEPRLRQIGFLLRKRLFADALAAAQDATAALPRDANILQAVGQAQMQAGDIEQAINTFRRLAAELPTSAQPQMMLADVYGTAGKPAQAEAAVLRALEIDPNLTAAQSALVELYAKSKRLGPARDYIQRFKTLRPTEAAGYVLESALFFRQNDREAGIRALREGLAKTNSPAIAERLFTVLSMDGRVEEAERFGLAWLQKRPTDTAMEYLLSVNEISRGKLAAAERRLQRVVAASPNNALALNNLSWVILQTGGPGALAFAKRAVEIQPERAEFLDTLAQALASDKQYKPALAVQRRAMYLAPTNHSLRLTLARIAVLAGEKGTAREELTRLKELGAGFKGHAEVTALLSGL